VTVDPLHGLYLEKHGIDVDFAEALGVRSIMDPADLPAPFQYLKEQGTPALLYPWRSPDGREWPQLHPDTIPVIDGEERKYVFPSKKHHPEIGTPTVWKLWEPDKPRGVLLVEGTKQALAVASTRPAYIVFALAGCSSWYEDGAPIADLDGLFDGLDVVVLFDGDLGTNPNVYDQAARMLDELPIFTGATSVKFGKPIGSKEKNLDDILGARPAGEPRERLLEGIIGAAKDKLGKRPPDQDPRVSRGFFTIRPNRSVALLVENVAEALDGQAPWGWQEDGDILYRYNRRSGVYERVGAKAFEAHLARLLRQDYEARFARDMLGPVKSLAAANERVIDPSAAPSSLIPLANGVLDPSTGELQEHSPDHLLLGSWAVEHDPDATCPMILAYLEHQFPGQVEVVLATMARVLERRRDQDRVLFLFGPPRAAKSTILRLLAALVGPSATSSVSLHSLVTDKFKAARLYGKALNVSADLSADDLSRTDIFKQVTGGDGVEGEFKYHDSFTFTNHALLAFAANSIPGLPTESSAEEARLVPVYAPRTYVGAEDPSIEEAMMAELPGLLNELLRRYQSKAIPAPVPAVAAEFWLRADRVRRFVLDRCVPLPDDAKDTQGEEAGAVYTAFKAWVSDNEGAARAMGRNRFYRAMGEAGFPVVRSSINRFRVKLRPGHGARVPSDGHDPEFQKWLVELEDRARTPFAEGLARWREVGGPASPHFEQFEHFSARYARAREKEEVRGHTPRKNELSGKTAQTAQAPACAVDGCSRPSTGEHDPTGLAICSEHAAGRWRNGGGRLLPDTGYRRATINRNRKG
jgi:putative DNA primase/helicase